MRIELPLTSHTKNYANVFIKCQKLLMAVRHSTKIQDENSKLSPGNKLLFSVPKRWNLNYEAGHCMLEFGDTRLQIFNIVSVAKPTQAELEF